MERTFSIRGSIYDRNQVVPALIDVINTRTDLNSAGIEVTRKEVLSSQALPVNLSVFGRTFKSLALGGNRGLLPPGLLWINAEGSQVVCMDSPQLRNVSILIYAGHTGVVQTRVTLPIPYVIYAVTMASPTSFYVESIYFAFEEPQSDLRHFQCYPASLPNVYNTGKLCTHHPIDVTDQEAQSLSLADKINLAVSDFWSSQFNEEVREWQKSGFWRVLSQVQPPEAEHLKYAPPQLDVSSLTGSRYSKYNTFFPDSHMQMLCLIHKWAYFATFYSPEKFTELIKTCDLSNISTNYLSAYINSINTDKSTRKRKQAGNTEISYDDTLLDVAVAASFSSEVVS